MNLINVYLTKNELDSVINTFKTKVFMTESELNAKKLDREIVEIVKEELEKSKKLIAYLETFNKEK